ncbi:hypothetical protein HID58_018562, partial [Brassica napus]
AAISNLKVLEHSRSLNDFPEEADDEDSGVIPDMMFAAGEEPVGLRVLTYQSSSALKRIFNALDEEEIDIIQRSISSVIKMLYRKTVKDKEIRVKYACLALLESVLLPTSLKMKIAREHAEAIENLEEFFSYPWGRLAFDMLMGSIKDRDEVALSQNTIDVKGFALALQLVMVKAVPSLTEVVQEICSSSESDSEEIEGTGRDIFTKKNTLNPAHARNVDKQSNVHVNCLIPADSTRTIDELDLVWSDEEEDSKVDTLLARINRNHKFTNSLFRGGLSHTDVERLREAGKSTSKSRKATYIQGHVQHVEPGTVAENFEKKINVASSTVAGIEGKVVLRVEDMLLKFKSEMNICVKEMVAEICEQQVVPPPVRTEIPRAVPVHVPGPATVNTEVDDANAITIGNVLRNISEYSTPPRSTRMSQDENLSPFKKDDVVPRFVCVTPEAETCVQSANSLNRTRQNAFHQSLEGHKRQRENVTSEPSFSLGLTQDEQIKVAEPCLVIQARDQECSASTNVVENIEQGQGSRKSKRHKTVPSGLVEDYQCGRHIMSRVREGQNYVFVVEDQSEVRRKYAQLCVKLGEKFVINVGGLAVYAKDIQLLLERPRLFPPKVIDILIRVGRLAVSRNLRPESRGTVEFLDTKFATFPKFLNSRNKESYKFPKGLVDIFPSKDDPAVHLIRFYFPFNVGTKHWVGICFDARLGVLTVWDCNTSIYKDSTVEKHLNSIIQMLPYLARYVGQSIGEEPVMHCYDVSRPKFLAQNTNPSDSRLMAMLLMTRHAVYSIDACKNISPDILEEEGRRAAILMSTSLRPRLFHGAWNQNEDGHWIFQRKPSDLGYTVLVKQDETFEDLETIIRDRYRLTAAIPLSLAYHPPEWLLEPEGTRTPPTTLTSTSDVKEMMGLRSWYAELTLCVTSGAEDVSHYQFLTNTTFSIRRATFVFTELVASKEILEEIFNEKEQVGMYRPIWKLRRRNKVDRMKHPQVFQTMKLLTKICLPFQVDLSPKSRLRLFLVQSGSIREFGSSLLQAFKCIV